MLGLRDAMMGALLVDRGGAVPLVLQGLKFCASRFTRFTCTLDRILISVLICPNRYKMRRGNELSPCAPHSTHRKPHNSLVALVSGERGHTNKEHAPEAEQQCISKNTCTIPIVLPFNKFRAAPGQRQGSAIHRSIHSLKMRTCTYHQGSAIRKTDCA